MCNCTNNTIKMKALFTVFVIFKLSQGSEAKVIGTKELIDWLMEDEHSSSTDILHPPDLTTELPDTTTDFAVPAWLKRQDELELGDVELITRVPRDQVESVDSFMDDVIDETRTYIPKSFMDCRSRELLKQMPLDYADTSDGYPYSDYMKCVKLLTGDIDSNVKSQDLVQPEESTTTKYQDLPEDTSWLRRTANENIFILFLMFGIIFIAILIRCCRKEGSQPSRAELDRQIITEQEITNRNLISLGTGRKAEDIKSMYYTTVGYSNTHPEAGNNTSTYQSGNSASGARKKSPEPPSYNAATAVDV